MPLSKDQVFRLMCPGDCTPEWQESFENARIDQIGCTFLEDPSTTMWMDGSGLQILWGHGLSSSGKTFIASKLVDHINLKQKRREGHQATAIYFFDPNLSQYTVDDFESSICSIARQLAAQLPTSSTGVLDQISETTEFYPLTDGYEDSAKIFHDMLSTFDHLYLVLDGINASDQVVLALLDFLSGGEPHGRNMHILFTSRNPPPNIQATYGMSVVQVRVTEEDLQRFILHEAGMDGSEIQRSGNEDTFQTALTDILRLTDFCFPPLPLYRGMDPAALLATLSNAHENASKMPAGSETTALSQFTMLQISKVYGLLASRVLHLVAKLEHLKYPKTATVITDMIRVLGATRANGTFYTVSDIIESCRGFIIVSHKDLEIKVKSPFLENYLLGETCEGKMNGDLVQASLKYLCGENFRLGPCKTAADMEQRFQKYPFLPCASRIVSACIPTQSDVDSILDQFFQLASDPRIFETYLQAAQSWPYRDKASYAELEASEPKWRPMKPGITVLHLAVIYKWGKNFVEGILRRGVDIDAVTTTGLTALHLAIEVQSQTKIVQVLLRSGAEVSAIDQDGNTPLSRAVVVGSLGTVKLLVRHGAPVDDLCEDILVECSVSQPEIWKYLTELGVSLPDIPTEWESSHRM
ncbi:ankyrin repeat domain-containing protein [Aspergillus affinis]|uniref:ankyrin repeat domain-containing protein n=1 Tax=Aspergillus affinis TaxID=1070780 RepID=UPI0022FF3C0A|nr:uncharacterized protein KD926_001796 [Aspergillus affinis]KAI9036453.1 hypothetical protein KD926_001796 [Aspergillus affinis]